MLYGSKEMLDNRVATLVGAADTVEEFTGFLEAVKGQGEGRNWEETYASNFLDHMQKPMFKGFKHSVLAVYHTDAEQRDAFWTEWSLTELQSNPLKDRHLDMLHNKQEEVRIQNESPEDKGKTIEERLGLDKNDPWDRRTEEEVEADNKMKEQMKEMRQKGELSGDSFGGADAQRASRDRPDANNVPGAYSRTQAAEALKVFDETLDTEPLSNDELADKLREAGVPDVQGVYNDGEVPQKAKGAGDIFVDDIQADRNEDGSFNITGVQAHKRGGEVDEVAKAANEAAHTERVTTAKAGRKSFSPEDFGAVLRGDGSADAVTHVEGDNRQTRQADPNGGQDRPKLSDEAENARREHQIAEAAAAKSRRQQAQKEQDVKARGERDRGIFKGADLVEDEDMTAWDDLPEEIRTLLESNGLKRDELAVKNYPFNSELGGRALLPTDTTNPEGMRMVGNVNLSVEGSMTMGGPGVLIVSREDTTKDGYGIYAKKRRVQVKNEGGLDLGENIETKMDIYLVRVRAG